MKLDCFWLRLYSTGAYLDEPVFQAGVVAPGNLPDLIACYLSVLSGLIVLNSQGVDGYQMPGVDMLMRIVTAKC